jgi:hypothetical protein
LGRAKNIEKTNTPDLFQKYANDEKYKNLIEAHKGLSKSDSELLNNKLILMLMDKVSQEELEDILKSIK